MKKANKTTWDALLEIYKNETDASERLKLMKGLSSIENEDILKKYVLGFLKLFYANMKCRFLVKFIQKLLRNLTLFPTLYYADC